MTDLVKKKKSRAGHRQHARKLVGKAHDILEEEGAEDYELQDLKASLKEKFDKIRALDEGILLHMESDEGVDEDGIAQEIEESGEFCTAIRKAILRIDSRLRASAGANENGTPSKVAQPEHRQVQAKLPKLEVKRFGGKVCEFQEFWDSFESSIHSNKGLSDVDKFSYLRGLLEEQAKAAVAGFSLTGANYQAAVSLLKRRFGKKTAVQRAHMAELMKTSAVYSERDTARLRTFCDHVETHYRGLEALGVSEDTYSSIVVPSLLEKLPETLRLTMTRGEAFTEWTVGDLMEKLRGEVELREEHHLQGPKGTPERSPPRVSSGSALVTNSHKSRCAFCLGDHAPEACKKFTEPEKRKQVARKYSRCFICLNKGHMASKCRDKNKCKACNGDHHVAICNSSGPRGDASTQGGGVESTVGMLVKAGTKVALQTAQGLLLGQEGKTQRVRVIFDSCSHRSFITERAAKSNIVKIVRKEWLNLSTFGGTTKSSGLVDVAIVNVRPVGGGTSIYFECCVVPEITRVGNVHVEVVKRDFPYLKGLFFSDVDKNRDSLQVDLLVGADYLWNFQEGRIIRGERDEPVAIETKLGWVLSGPLKGECSVNDVQPVNAVVNAVVTDSGKTDSIEKEIRKLWDLDSVGVRELDEVHEEFSDNIAFNGSRYSVRLPWKVSHATLPSNYEVSHSRMKGQLRKLGKEPELLTEYDRIIKEQEELGIIEKVPALDTADNVHYLPHQAVVRKDAVTTKVRVVYDASAKEGKHGVSLNDCLHVGPSLNPLLFDILLRFRENRVALVGDIEKAFLNVEVDERDRDYLRFLWVDNINDSETEVNVYRFCRVVFGLNASPFLLNATIRHHLATYEGLYPEFVTKMTNGFYVDDLVSGGSRTGEVYELYNNARSRMAEGGFKLRKWLTNDRDLREKIQEIESNVTNEGNSGDSTGETDESYAKATLGTHDVSKRSQKVLGVSWNYEKDMLHLDLEQVAAKASEKMPTKRSVLSIISSIFDPLGIISPLTVSMKMLLQELCANGVDWDQTLPPDLKSKWERWVAELVKVRELSIERCVYSHPEQSVTKCWLHGFGDASKKAYCAVVYLVYQLKDGSRHARLLTSKTRVAPLKQLTIPRLELMSAVILSQLMQTVKEALSSQVKIDELIYWLDSKTVLCWIRNKGEWKQFVRHRINSILERTNKESWRHCPGTENPADIGSRGANASTLKNDELWWTGPQWLCRPEREWPAVHEGMEQTVECLHEAKKSEVNSLLINGVIEQSVEHIVDINRCSTYRKLVRVTAWVVRFVNNLRSKVSGGDKVSGELSAKEVIEAQGRWVKVAQQALKRQDNFSELRVQLGLIEREGVLRCQGRLVNSDLDFEARTPLVLPKDHRLAELIVKDSHQRVNHSGVKATLAEVRAKYWIPRGRQVVKKILSTCVICKKNMGRPYNPPPTSALPDFRVRESPPFSKVGIDFAGPLYAKGKTGTDKVYIALFSCCVTRAIHLELVEDLSAEAFRRCLRKFTARRGVPSLIVSDNAKTFQATEKALRQLFNHPEVQAYLSDMRIEWRFNLPKAPWWGGFFERMVGSVKQCLRKVLGNASLTFDELATVLAETEATLNCRPLTYEYNEVGEEVLTPSHLVHGRRINSIPDEVIEPEDVGEEVENSQKRFQHMSLKLAHFWERWRKEYLTDLREYHRVCKSRQGNNAVEVGDVVLVYEDGKKRNQWKMAVLEELIRGRDGVVRGARVRKMGRGKHTRISRPIQRLYPIEVKNDENATGIGKGNRKGKQNRIRNGPKRNAAVQARDRIKAFSMLDS